LFFSGNKSGKKKSEGSRKRKDSDVRVLRVTFKNEIGEEENNERVF
jgi:hypothetical protein